MFSLACCRFGQPDDDALVEAVVTLGRRLGKRVVAEGVETASQLDFLRAIGCDVSAFRTPSCRRRSRRATDPRVLTGLDVAMDGSSDGYSGRVEVIEGRGRRLRSEAERARIAAESLVAGAKVADVARRHGVTRWQVYDWRRKLTAGKLAVPASAMSEPPFAALVVERPPTVAKAPARRAAGRIELVVDGVTIRVGAEVDEARLSQVIRAVRAASR